MIGFKITADRGRLKADNFSLGQLIEFAYNVPATKIIGQLPRDTLTSKAKPTARTPGPNTVSCSKAYWPNASVFASTEKPAKSASMPLFSANPHTSSCRNQRS